MTSFKLKKGHNLRIKGKPNKKLSIIENPNSIKIHPIDFIGIKSKLLIKEGDIVKVGTPLFINKHNPNVNFVSPGSGIVKSIKFASRRTIEEICIEQDEKLQFEEIKKISLEQIEDIPNENIKELLLKSGLWTKIRQRPFSKIADPTVKPKNIFISAVDSAPYSGDTAFILSQNNKGFQVGLYVLNKLTDGTVYLSIDKNKNSSLLTEAKGVSIQHFSGPHPAGNIGIQVHHISPITSKNDVIWYISPQDVNAIGESFLKGQYYNRKIITVGGPNLQNPQYYSIQNGTPLTNILKNENISSSDRVISGDVLTGAIKSLDQSPRHYDEIVSVLPEDKDREFLGWAKLGFKKYSTSRAFLSSLLPKREAVLSTNLNGSLRSIISLGNWEKMLPMDILPEFIIKSILANDIEEMEALGIYECDPEDFALCSFACQSKVEVSDIISQGLELVEKES